MKGTFISSDYVKARDNSIRFIEANTDTIVYDDILDVEFSWQPLVDFLSGSYNTLHIVSKPEIHYNSVQNLISKVETQLPNVAISQSTADLFAIIPPAVTDAEDKFILRMAYDGGAIVDSEYCANSFNALTLMEDAGSGSAVVPFYGHSGSVVYNTLNTASYTENVPNAVTKWKNVVIKDVRFHQLTDWAGYVNTVSSSAFASEHKYLQSFEISDESLSDEAVWSYRNYSIAYGSNLDTIDCGTAIKYAEFGIPSTSQVDIQSISSNTELDIKHYYEYSTSIIKAQNRRAGLFDTEHFVSASGDPISFDDIKVGDVLRSFHVIGMPDTDEPSIYYDYKIDGSTWPSGSTLTGSIVTSDVIVNDNDEGVLIGLDISGSSETYYIGPNTSILSYHSGSDNIKFRTVSNMDEDDVYLVNTDNSISDIVSNKLIILNSPTGSFRTLGLEPTDNVVVGDTPMFYFAFHNK